MKIGAIAQYNYFLGSQKSKTPGIKTIKKIPTPEQMEQHNSLRVFNHHIYEYQKGLRSLVLTTEKAKYQDAIEQKLQKEGINYVVHPLSERNINVYFGDKPCIDVVKTFNPNLKHLTPEQDFMLGIMLGYDKVKQCERYMNVKSGKIKLGPPQE